MVEKFKEVLKRIVGEKGQVYLFAIMKMDDITDKWSVIISAPWVDQNDQKEIFEFVIKQIVAVFNSEEQSLIARVGLLDKETHLVEELLKYKKDSSITGKVKINGNIIHEAYILESNQRL